MNPYDVLQVSPIADTQVIRAAYRSLIQRYHPDRNPGDESAAQHAVRVTQAYELLADPERRAAYDEQALADRTAPFDATAPRGQPRRSVPRSSTAARPKPTGANWTLWVIALLLVLCAAWAVRYFVLIEPRQAAPDKQLADIRTQIESTSTSEAQRRELWARKQTVLEQHAGLLKADSALRAEDMAGRSLALLLEPITVSLALPTGLDATALQLSIPEITLVLGSFDTPKLNEHLLKHRARVNQELMQKLATQGAAPALAPDAQARLRSLVRESVMASLDIGLNETYPSTYFESPGRYGVVDVIFPKNFLLLK